MSELPRVMIGGPVRDREWIVPTWLNALLALDYPPEKLTLAVLVNDSADGTAGAAHWWADQAVRRGIRANVGECHFGCEVDNNLRLGERDYVQFARARDAWVGLRSDEEWLLQVDSDVQVPADLLRRLVALATQHEVSFLAACLLNAWGAPLHASNVMVRNRELGMLLHPWDLPRRRGQAGVQPCDLTGACALLHRDIFDAGLRYELPGVAEHSEDGPFCALCAERGWQPHYAPSVWATHWMQRPEESRYLRDRQQHTRLAAWHQHCAEEIRDGESIAAR